jgi:hypothetical protein
MTLCFFRIDKRPGRESHVVRSTFFIGRPNLLKLTFRIVYFLETIVQFFDRAIIVSRTWHFLKPSSYSEGESVIVAHFVNIRQMVCLDTTKELLKLDTLVKALHVIFRRCPLNALHELGRLFATLAHFKTFWRMEIPSRPRCLSCSLSQNHSAGQWEL